MTCFAVIDTETTGLYFRRFDRIVEVAVVLVTPDVGVSVEFSTLVNPERDVGPTSIHGLTASDLVDAPRFPEIAGELIDLLARSDAVVGHNVHFDLAFLRAEFERMGLVFPTVRTLDTMVLAGGGTLAACCGRHGICCDGRLHSALDDARMTASLLDRVLCTSPLAAEHCEPVGQVVWPEVSRRNATIVTRSSAGQHATEPSRYIQRLVDCLSADCRQESRPENERRYRSLLSRVLEDRRVDDDEIDALLDLAASCGLSLAQVRSIHRDYLSELTTTAWADRSISAAERREVHMVARLLGLPALSDSEIAILGSVPRSENNPEIGQAQGESWVGQSICFTGECQCSIKGILISRDLAEELARGRGLIVKSSVTKKLDLLVVGDPNSQSSKAKKARQYEIRIVHEPVFWRTLGIAID